MIPKSHLVKTGINGNILKAIQALYNNVRCSVKINDSFNKRIDVTRGLKQGCVMSPLIFNLFINDLVTEINNLGIGLNINGRKISML